MERIQYTAWLAEQAFSDLRYYSPVTVALLAGIVATLALTFSP